jgi:signal transduction histidine kinase
MEDRRQRYWAQAYRVIICTAVFILLVIMVQSNNPLHLFFTVLGFPFASEFFLSLRNRFRSYALSLFVLRYFCVAILFVLVEYFGGPNSPAWLFGLIPIAGLATLFYDVAPEFMHNATLVLNLEGDEQLEKIPINMYSLGITLGMSVHISACSYILWRDIRASSTCFITLVLFSCVINFVAAMVRELRNYTRVLIENKSLEEQKRIAVHESEQKTLFIAKMSHELRTPLHAVISCCDLISDTLLSREQKGFIKIIDKSSKLLLSLIDTILDLSKYQAGHLELELKPYALRDCVETVVSTVKTKESTSKSIISLNIAQNVPDHVIGDEVRLTQIVSFSLLYD